MRYEQKESELRFRVHDLNEYHLALNSIGAVKIEETTQIDNYYKEKSKEEEPDNCGSTIYRVRINETLPFIVFTRKKSTATPGTWLETEFTGLPIEFQEVLEEILLKGFSNILTLKKDRRRYKINNLIVSLDTIHKLGSFVEIEAIDQDNSFSNISELAIKLGLDITKKITDGYVTLMKQINMEA